VTADLDRRSATPLWRQVLADLTRRVAAGEFTEGFPGEHALRAQYGVSRQTVRQALRTLREEGVVTAERGRAPRLGTPTEIEQPLGALYSLFASVRAAGIDQRSIVRILAVHADGVVADRLGLDGSTPLLHLERLRLAGDEPLALDRVWLPADIAAPLRHADFTDTSLYTELARRCGLRLTGGHEHLRAVVPTPRERKLLQLDSGVAAFAIDRLGTVGERAVEWRTTLIRGDRFSVSAEFTARAGYPLQLHSTHHRTDIGRTA